MIRQVAHRPILTAEQMRETERRAFERGGETAESLMERAGLEVARHVRRIDATRPVLVLAGPGNNGGDAYVAARHLRDWSHDVRVVAFGPAADGVAAHMAGRWAGPTIVAGSAFDLGRGYIVVDGLFGTGAVRDAPPPGWSIDLVTLASRRVAIDVPSWIDSDTGGERDWGRGLRADVTVALGALKQVHMLRPDACGHLMCLDLGLVDSHDGSVQRIKDFEDFTWRAMGDARIAPPAPAAHKYRGPVTIVSGAMPGAARLAARGAAGAGAGYVVLLGDPVGAGPFDGIVHRPRDDFDAVLESTKGVVVIGPGLGRDAAAVDLLDRALAAPCPLVVDGDALSLLGSDAIERLRARPGGKTVLTPHEAEFTRMFGDDAGSKFDRSQTACLESAAVVIHKGRCTIVARPWGDISASTGGSTWLATAGTGDVLAGAVAARWACDLAGGGCGDPFDAAVQLHARASHLAGPAFSADRLAECLPAAMMVTT